MDSIELRLLPGESAVWTIQDPLVEFDASAQIHLTHLSHPQLRSQIFLTMNDNPSRSLSLWQESPSVIESDQSHQPLEFTLSIAPSLDERWYDELLTFDLELVPIIQDARSNQQEEVLGLQHSQPVMDGSMIQLLLSSIVIVVSMVGLLTMYVWKRIALRSSRENPSDDPP